jgi:hypothetical protein
MMIPEPSMGFLDRVEAVEERLERLVGVPPGPALTDPDPATGERWEWGQVWAHLAEFPAYWMERIRLVLSEPPEEAPPFGRVKSDPTRLEAIEADRRTPASELWQRVQDEFRDVRVLLQEMTAEDWERRVTHSTLGVMDMQRVVDEFLVGHLEEHTAQLEGLAPGVVPPEA